jgi:glycosyltransferase involved in cell wall biosynthesis
MQLRGLFARARVVVLPYTATTGSSSVLHRAAAFGRPMVASDLPDMRAVADEENLLVNYAPPGEAAGLAEALARLLADPERQAAQARHNYEAMRAMTLDHTCARYVALFGQAAGRGLD